MAGASGHGALWGIEDPAAVEGSDIERYAAFVRALRYLKTRVSLFATLPLTSLDKITLRSQLRAIGREAGASAGIQSAEDTPSDDTQDPAH